MTDNRTTERVDHPPRVREAIDELMREKDATDNRTTELREMLDDLIIELDRLDITLDSPSSGMTIGEYEQEREKLLDGFMQAIAATLGRPKAKSHPYGYERDTGAYDCTRCECGCINDISATYCNDCGGEIEIDVYAEKEIYRIPRHIVFAEKHDDGSLELCERRYVPEDAATLGGEREQALEELVKQLWYLVNHRSSYGYAAALEAIEELGIEVDE